MKDFLDQNINFSQPEDILLTDSLAKSILNEINAFIFIFDVETLTPLWINKYFKDKMGYSNNELESITKEEFTSLFHPKSLPLFLDRIKNILKNGNKELKTVYQLRSKNQEWIYLLTSSRIFRRDKDGSIKYLIGYASEVSSHELKHHLKEITSVKRKCDNLPLISSLSRREFDIIRLISRGFTDKEIAAKLNISIHTTKTHRKRIIQKLEVKNTAALVKFAVENSLC